MKENFTADSSSNVMNYVEFTAVMAGSISLKQYLEDQKILPSSMSKYLYTMASIAIMAGGAVLNAVTFIGGNYLARYLSRDDPKAAQEEKVRHDKALEAYQAAYTKYQKDHTKLLDWIATNDQIKDQAKQNFTYTDYAFKLYNQAHQHEQISMPKEPVFSDFYQPSKQQKKKANSCLLAQAPLPLGTQPFDFFEFFYSYIHED